MPPLTLSPGDSDRLGNAMQLFNAAGISTTDEDQKYVEELFLRTLQIEDEDSRTSFRAAFFYWYIVNPLLETAKGQRLSWSQIYTGLEPDGWLKFSRFTFEETPEEVEAPCGRTNQLVARPA